MLVNRLLSYFHVILGTQEYQLVGEYFLYPFSVSFLQIQEKIHTHIHVCSYVCVHIRGYIPFLDMYNVVPHNLD